MATAGVAAVDLSSLLGGLRDGSWKDVTVSIQKFNEQHQKTFKFEEDLTTREEFCRQTLRVLSRTDNGELSSGETCKLCAALLASLRLLAREKAGLGPLTTREGLGCILRTAGLLEEVDGKETVSPPPEAMEVVLEGLKCAYNLTFNSPELVPLCCDLGVLRGLADLLPKQPSLPGSVSVFAVKLLFLVTSLHPPARSEFVDTERGLEVLVGVVEGVVQAHRPAVQGATCLPSLTTPLDSAEMLFISDAFRILFALTMSWYRDEESFPQRDKETCLRLAGLCQVLLISIPFSASSVHEGTLQCVYDAALNLPLFCAGLFTKPLPQDAPPPPPPQSCQDGLDMTVVGAAVAFLDCKLKQEQPKAAMSVVGTLRSWAKANRSIRRFLRVQILPPLGRVTQRPDEGDSVKSRLIRNMAASLFGVEDLTSDLLFLLCKENSARFIKYVGYGHAAGLLMSRGLLGGGNPPQHNDYSDDSDSDTEEYKQCKDNIDPVTGGPSKKGPSALDLMTPEEKEREMDKLEQTLDKLNKTGVLKMVGVDKDGRAKVVEPSLEGPEEPDSSDND